MKALRLVNLAINACLRRHTSSLPGAVPYGIGSTEVLINLIKIFDTVRERREVGCVWLTLNFH